MIPGSKASQPGCNRVQVTVVDGTGRRFPIRGMEGQTLVEVLENHEGPLDVSDCESCSVVAARICRRHCAGATVMLDSYALSAHLMSRIV